MGYKYLFEIEVDNKLDVDERKEIAEEISGQVSDILCDMWGGDSGSVLCLPVWIGEEP